MMAGCEDFAAGSPGPALLAKAELALLSTR
jgi:hypothetical protein